VTRAPLSTVKSRLYRGLAALKPEILKLRAGASSKGRKGRGGAVEVGL
jgi:RNA polymerase sigma-70 factor (ECF subfamily)